MAEHQLEFFVLRYVPDAVKQECVNVGLLLFEPGGDYSAVRFTRDWSRVSCIDPDADLEVLQAFEADLATQLVQGVSARERAMKRISESFSNQLQISDRKACLAESPQAELDTLARIYLEPRRVKRASKISPREHIREEMQAAFEQEGIWDQLWKEVPARDYTFAGDPLKIDCGYQPNGFVRMFHGISLEAPESAKALAFSYPQLAAGIRRQRNAELRFTAIVESVERDERIEFSRSTLERSGISISTISEMPAVAQRARRELFG